MEVDHEVLPVEPGQLIGEYAAHDPDRLWCSYIVLGSSGFEGRCWLCICLYNSASDVKHKPGDTCFINKNWIVPLIAAKQLDWPTYWRAQNGR